MSHTPETPCVAPDVDETRRRLLFGASVLPVVAGSGLTVAAQPAQAALKTSARIVIAGSGLGGLAIANRLSRELDGAKITIIDRKEIHNYQPGYTLVATGIWPVGKVSDRNADLVPAGVEWVREMVAEFDPEANAVVTDSGKRIEYDYLVVATGLHLDFAQIEGMDVAAIGTNGLGCVYPSPEAAQATWMAMDRFRQQGGHALMTLPATPLKCAGAPLKMTFMIADRLKQAGTRAASKIDFHSALGNIFSVPRINEEVLRRWAELDIPVTFNSKLVAVDIGSRRATVTSPEGERTEIDYDFIHVVPPMRAPDSVKNSPLSWKEGGFAAGGWLEVDPKTLRHRRFPNVFGIGDINGTAKGKTAATVKKSAPLVAQHLIEVIAGREPSLVFDGYTSCPLLLREGSALLIEFDYENNLTPSLPMIDPLQDSYFAWVMKYRLLKPAYMAVAKGRV
ncbi:pyridine nucleotide-disulfide oxidoreductase [Thauera propionica]|uniref:Pyridine nucleotide-disulfide oxidoreductase n=1 Tax=Thauera propionica TaxID=2019431 RepID=A0A235EW93_9RHOO|nr:FAD/NAD(P)-binding oxidoreductase [Thauera propionica]OYD53322.1 pyridine nucleotide-disulfide oxidoreductase [Thauera propionica]